MSSNFENKKIYYYPVWNRIKVFIGLIVFIIGFSFSLNYFATNNLPPKQNINYDRYVSEEESSKLILTTGLLIISSIVIISSVIYLYEYFSKFEVTNEYIKKNRILAPSIIIKLDDIVGMNASNFVFITRVKDKTGKSIFIIPSLKDYNPLIIMLFNRFEKSSLTKTIELSND